MEELRPAQDVVVVVLEVVVLWQTHQVAVLDLQQVLSLSSTYTSLTDTHHLHCLVEPFTQRALVRDKATLLLLCLGMRPRHRIEGVLHLVGTSIFLVAKSLIKLATALSLSC
jgi:hypothetical protein